MEEEKFPSKIPSDESQWATLCYGRSPEFKVHSKRGLAHSAIANKKPSHEIAMYELKEGEWHKVWEYEFPTICECGKTYEHTSTTGFTRKSYHVAWGYDGKVMDAPVVCRECYNKSYKAYTDRQTRERELAQLADLNAKYGSYGHLGGLENLIKKD